MKLSKEKQITLDEYRIHQTNHMINKIGITHASRYRRKLVRMFNLNIRANGTGEERLYEYLQFRVKK